MRKILPEQHLLDVDRLKQAGRLADADIADFEYHHLPMSALVRVACKTYYLAREHGGDAVGYRLQIEAYIGFQLPIDESLTLDQYDARQVDFYARTTEALQHNFKHRPIHV